MLGLLKKLYIWTSGYSYTNLGRLFLRMFVGVMLMQFGVRQWMTFHEIVPTFPSVLEMSSQLTLSLMIFIEIFCSFFIMIGFCTRFMAAIPMIAMMFAEHYLLSVSTEAPYMISWDEVGHLPVMFIGIYFFILLVGPGKISCDYFLSLHIIHTDDKSESELEEV